MGLYFFLQVVAKLFIFCVQTLNKMQSYWERNDRSQDNSNFRIIFSHEQIIMGEGIHNKNYNFK